MKQIDEYSYHCGVMDAFAEIVGAQVKQMALSHPFQGVEEMQYYVPYANELCMRYGIFCYEETALLITDLFPVSMNKGKCNLIFVKETEVWERYCALKQRKEYLVKHHAYYGQERKDIALAFGALLSYTKEACLEKINKNTELE